MKARSNCNCHDHMLEFNWESGDSYVTVGFWTKTRNWMGLRDRIRKAWDVFRWGSAMIDDVYIASPEDATAAAEVLMNYAGEEFTKRKDFSYTDEMKLRPMLEELKATAAAEEVKNCSCCGKPVLTKLQQIASMPPTPIDAIGDYLKQGVVRTPLPKQEE